MLKFPSLKGKRNYVFSKRGTADSKEDIKKWSLQKQKTRNIQKVFGQKIFMEETCKFTWKQYIALLFLYKSSFGHITKYNSLLNYYGPNIFLVVYTISYWMLITPMIMLYLFLGRYSKRSGIKVWDIMPLFKGIGYSIVLLLCVRTIRYYTLGSIMMFYTFESFNDPLPWSSCNFKDASPDCVDSSTHDEMIVSTTECCIQSIVPTYSRCDESDTGTPLNFAARDYFNTHVMGQSEVVVTNFWANLGSINTRLVPYLVLAWLLTYVCTFLGFRRFKFIVTKLLTFVYILLFIRSLFALIFGHVAQINSRDDLEFFSDKIYDIKAHLSLITTLIIDAVPDLVILFGAYGPRTLPVNLDVLIYSALNMLFTLVIFLSNVTLHNGILKKYGAVPLSCLVGTGHEIYLVVIPELLSQTAMPNLALIFHFLSLSTLAVTSGAIIVLGISDLTMDAFPMLLPHRIHFCLIICVFCFLINLPFLTKSMGVLSTLMYEYVEMFTSLIIAIPSVVAIMWIYGIERIKRDYEFVHGHPPGTYWIVCWKYIPFCYIFILIHNAVVGIADINKKAFELNPGMLQTCFVVTGIICSPIVIFAFVIYIRHIKNRTVKTMFRSSTTWGDPDPKVRHNRLIFNPLKEVRYKKDGHTTCTHNCLLNSKYLKEEIEYAEKNMEALMEQRINDTEKKT